MLGDGEKGAVAYFMSIFLFSTAISTEDIAAVSAESRLKFFLNICKAREF
jgi:hypothetical protein